MEKSLARRISVPRYIGVLVACVASVSARVRRENWDESKKRGMRGEGREGNATQARVLVIWVFVIWRFHCFIITSRLSLGPSSHYFELPRKSYRGIGLRFTQVRVMAEWFLGRSEAALRRSRKWSFTYRVDCMCSLNTYSTRRGSN